MTDITSYDDIIDVRDITDRVEELREVRDGLREEFDAMPENAGVDFANWVRNQIGFSSEEFDELQALEGLLDDIRGYGGDHQWEGDWYPITLIRDSHFTEYAMELLADIGDLPRNMPHYVVIDEEATAENIRADYSDIEFDGATYWYR
ncbi:Uncharacterised protein [Burkholderia pseudomallei]|nr:Uncharacterised protein [Burkholderia pseudomallei]